MSPDPKISVIIPTYNYGAFIADCLESVLRQSCQDFEVLLMDDGSRDSTPQVVESFRARFAGRLHAVRYEKNQGVYKVRNDAIRAARGRYIAFLDADDIWEPGALETLSDYLETHPHEMMVYANTQFFYDDTKKDAGLNFGRGSGKTPCTGRCAAELFLRGNFIPFMTTVLRREVFDTAGLFDEKLKVGGDYDLFMRIACLCPIGYVDQVLCRVRRHGRNLSFRGFLQAITQVRILKKALQFFSEHGLTLEARAVDQRWAQIYYELGVALALTGKPRRARFFLKRSLRLNRRIFSNKAVLYWLLSFTPFAGLLECLRTRWHVTREKLRIQSR